MKTYYVKHMTRDSNESNYKPSGTKIAHIEVIMVKGGIVIPTNRLVVTTNAGNFARIFVKTHKETKKKSYMLDLGFKKIEVIIIPDGLDTFIIDIESWSKHKDSILDHIELLGSAGFLPHTKNFLEISQMIRKDLDEYILSENS